MPDLLRTAMHLPAGMRIRGIRQDSASDSWAVVVEGDALPAVQEGTIPPDLRVTFTEVRDPKSFLRTRLLVEVHAEAGDLLASEWFVAYEPPEGQADDDA